MKRKNLLLGALLLICLPACQNRYINYSEGITSFSDYDVAQTPNYDFGSYNDFNINESEEFPVSSFNSDQQNYQHGIRNALPIDERFEAKQTCIVG